MICLGDKEINIDALIKLFDESQRELKEDAKKRLEKYALHYCMSCCDRYIKEGEEMKIKTTDSEYNQIAFLCSETETNSQNEMAIVTHVLWKKCVVKLAKKEEVKFKI